MIDAQGIQETIDRILHLCLRFIACCRIQVSSDLDLLAAESDMATRGGGGEKSSEYAFIPSEEFEQIQKEFYQQISFLFQSMKSSDSRGFLFRLDFNNYLSGQIVEMQQQHQQRVPPVAGNTSFSMFSR